jgi:hypothetical protein
MSFFSDIRKALFNPKEVVSTERPLSNEELINNLKRKLNKVLNKPVYFKTLPLSFNAEKYEYINPSITQVMFIDSFMKNIINNITQDIILDIKFSVYIPPNSEDKRYNLYVKKINDEIIIRLSSDRFKTFKTIKKESLMGAINAEYMRQCEFEDFKYRILNIEENIEENIKENIEGDDITDTNDNSDILQPIITYKLFNILLSDSFFKLLENTQEEYNNEILTIIENKKHFFFKIKINCPKYEVTALRELNTLSYGKFFDSDQTSLWDTAARQQTEAPQDDTEALQDDTKSFLGAETCINATLYFKDDLYYIINEDDIKNGDYSLGTGISYTNDSDSDSDIIGSILNYLNIDSTESILKVEYKIIPIGVTRQGGRKYNLKTQFKEILGKKMKIYKIANSRKEHVKYKCNIITLAEYRKLMKKKSNSKKVLKAKKAVVANKK